MYDIQRREYKARTMVTVLGDFLGYPLHQSRLLNVGGADGLHDRT